MASITITCNSKDCFARQSSPSTNYNEEYLVVGKTGAGTQTDRSFLYFDFSLIPDNAVITDARLYLRQRNSSYAGPNSLTFSVGRITGSWTETGVTWNSQPAVATAEYTALTCEGVSADTWKNWTITNTIVPAYKYVKGYTGGAAYTGLYLRATSETSSDNSKRFSSAEDTSYQPHIVVTYVLPTAPTPPTNLSLSPNAFEDTLRLTWVRGMDGDSNPITGQEVRYQTSADGVVWGAETLVSLAADAVVYDLPSPASIPRGTPFRFRVGAASAYAATVFSEYSASVVRNRPPGILSGAPIPDRGVYSPGETISLSFPLPSPADPDDGMAGGIAGYEAKLQSPDGVDYSGGQIVGAGDASGIISISTVGWSPGQQWRLLVRGFDTYGVRGEWSPPSGLIMIGAPLKVLVGGALRSVAEQKVLVNGELKQVSEIRVLLGGTLHVLTL